MLFSPFLIAFVIFVIINHPHGNEGDSERYLMYAKNLLHGFYSPPAPNIELINGPGYPILLMPFVALGLPYLCITLLNAVMYYLSIVVLYKSLMMIVKRDTAILFSFFWALYYVAYQSIPLIHTETLTYLLVTLMIYLLTLTFKKYENELNWKLLVLTGFVIGFIVLTKMIFGYVLIMMLLCNILFYILKRTNLNLKKSLLILLVALGTTTPYLIYTYNLTGKALYWGTGGDSLYWMTTPHEDEYGSWFPDKTMFNDPLFYTYYIPGTQDSIIRKHDKTFQEVYKYQGIAKDDVYHRLAIENIKNHPLKYAENVVYNFGRMFFQYPFSYGVQRAKVLMVFPLNGFLLTLILLCIIPTLWNWKRIPFHMRFLLLFAIIYLGGSLLVVAFVRMLTIVVPILIFWIAYIMQKTVTISFSFPKKTQQRSHHSKKD